MTMSAQANQSRSIFDAWRLANPHSEFVEPATVVREALIAAAAAGRSVIGDERLTSANVIEIARLILETSAGMEPETPGTNAT